MASSDWLIGQSNNISLDDDSTRIKQAVDMYNSDTEKTSVAVTLLVCSRREILNRLYFTLRRYVQPRKGIYEIYFMHYQRSYKILRFLTNRPIEGFRSYIQLQFPVDFILKFKAGLRHRYIISVMEK
jgi:hypothetical protein